MFSPDEALPTITVIIRSPTGRHVWTMRFCYNPRSAEVVYMYVCPSVCLSALCVCVCGFIGIALVIVFGALYIQYGYSADQPATFGQC